MTKKVFGVILTFILLLFTTSYVFATQSMSNEVMDSVNQTGNTMHNIGNGVEKAVDGVVSTGKNMVENVGNTFNSAISTTDNNNSNYNASRTSTSIIGGNNTMLGLSSMAWTWIIMAITAAVIVSLIYYYGSQYENITKVDNDNNNH